jgi:O-antigen/teichoic acid export membrane protein
MSPANGVGLKAEAVPVLASSARYGLRRGRARVRSAIAILRLRPFDTSTEVGRSMERYRRAGLSGIGGGLSKGVRLLNTIVAVPVTVGYLGAERFGLWMSMSSFIALAFGFADLGLGCVLQNVVSTGHGRNDREGTQRDLSSGFFLLLAAQLGMLGLFLLVYERLPWARIFGLHSPLATLEVGPAMAVFVISYLAATPLGVAARIQIGFQEGFRANIWDAVSAGFGVAGTLIAAFCHAALPVLVLASAGAPLIALTGNSIVEFCWRRPWLRPRWRWFGWRRGCGLIASGIQFLVAGAGCLAIMGAPVLVVGNRFGVAEAGPYALTYKVLSVPMTLLSLFWSSLWPAYAEAYARNDLHWIRRTLRRSWRLVALGPAPVVMALGFCTPWIVTAWTGGRLHPSMAEACATALFVVVTSLLLVYTMPLFACGRAKLPAVVLPIMGTLAFVPLIVPTAKLPVAGVPLWVAGCEVVALATFVMDSLRGPALKSSPIQPTSPVEVERETV